MKTLEPPNLAQRWLSACLPAALREPVLGDLTEEYIEYAEDGVWQAKTWYWRQAMRTSLIYLWQQRGDVMAFVISALVFVGLCLLAMLLGGELGMYFDIPSLIIVFPAALLFGIGATSYTTMKSCMALLMTEQLEVDVKEAKAAAHFLRVAGNAGLLVGLLMTLIGWVAMSHNIEPDMFSDVFGPAFAISVLTAIYGLAIKILCYVAEEKIQHYYCSQVNA